MTRQSSVFVAALMAILAAQGCSREERARQASEPAWVSSVSDAHALADSATTKEQQGSAVERLRAELGKLPADGPVGTRWVKQDLLARIAALELKLGRAEQALAAAEQGVVVSFEPSVPLANLYMAQGQALTLLGRKSEAIEPYYQALLVNEALMHAALEAEVEPR